jgi:hypothetical protein
VSETKPEPSVAELAQNVSELVSGMKWLLEALLLLASIPNFFVTLNIPRYRQIFQDALPGKPLPLLTEILINHSTFFLLLTLAFPIAGVVIISRGKRARNWLVAGTLLIIAVGAQLALTQFAMFAPMTDLFTGISDQTGGH